MLSVRDYQPSDADATIDIFLRAIREIASRDYDADQIAAWARVENREAWSDRRASRPTWLAMVGGLPAGFADLDVPGHIDMMFVHPRYQRVGVASLLLTTVEAAARDRAASRITTEASLTARVFFERRGFQVVAAQEVWKRGQAFRNFRMEKRLA